MAVIFFLCFFFFPLVVQKPKGPPMGGGASDPYSFRLEVDFIKAFPVSPLPGLAPLGTPRAVPGTRPLLGTALGAPDRASWHTGGASCDS